jgi:hypothetical protein
VRWNLPLGGGDGAAAATDGTQAAAAAAAAAGAAYADADVGGPTPDAGGRYAWGEGYDADVAPCGRWATWRSIWRHLDVAEEGFLTAPQFHERLAARGHSMTEAQVTAALCRPNNGPNNDNNKSSSSFSASILFSQHMSCLSFLLSFLFAGTIF